MAAVSARKEAKAEEGHGGIHRWQTTRPQNQREVVAEGVSAGARAPSRFILRLRVLETAAAEVAARPLDKERQQRELLQLLHHRATCADGTRRRGRARGAAAVYILISGLVCIYRGTVVSVTS